MALDLATKNEEQTQTLKTKAQRPATAINKQIDEALDWRYAVKKFDPNKKLSDQDWQTLQDSLVKSPSSYGLQPWQFIVVESTELREKLKPVSWGQTQVTDASHFVVFTSKEKITPADIENYMQRISEVRGVPRAALQGFVDMLTANVVNGKSESEVINWTQRQAYIAMGFLLETAALLGVDATPMEGIDPKAYDKILGLEGTGFKSVAAVALGYRHAEDSTQSAKKVRFEASAVIKHA